jgi:hypothetical protein
MRTPWFEIDRSEIREGRCGMEACTSNPDVVVGIYVVVGFLPDHLARSSKFGVSN